MADQRPTFRFRLPWLPPLPPTRPSIAPTTVTPTPIRPPPPPPPREIPAPAQTIPTPPPPSPPLQALEAQVPTQNPTTQEPPQAEETKVPTPTPPQVGETQNRPTPTMFTPPHTPLPPEAPRSQPSSPSHIAVPPQIPSPPSSPSRAGDVPRVLSQPSSPARAGATAQPRVSSQPSSPSRLAASPPTQPSSPSRPAASPPTQPSSPSRPAASPPTQPSSPSRPAASPPIQPSSPSRANTRPPVSLQPTSSSRAKITSPLGSPSRATIQPQNSSKPSSPARTPSRASPQPSSTPQTTSLRTSDSAGQTSASRSPYSPPDQHKPISETIDISSSPNQGDPKLSQERLQPSYTSQNNNPSASHKIQSNLHESEQYSMNQTSRQSSDESNLPKGSDTRYHTEKGDASRRLEHFLEDLKRDEAKEVKEVMKEINDNTFGKSRHQDDFLNDTLPVPENQAKEQTSITFQSARPHGSVGRNGKEVSPTSASNSRNKTMVGGDPRQKQVTSNTSNIPLHKEIRDDISKLVHKMSVEDPKLSTKDKPVNVITLAGENRGASMHLGSDSSKQGRAIQIHRGYKIKHDENDETTTTNEEGSSKNKIKDAKGTEDEEDKAKEAFVNSNIQGINNSIVFDSSISERNPGVHIIHSHFPETRRRDEQHEKKHGESSMVDHAQKLTHQPMVKRRCLRGLFLESSDSDSDDSSKPRRHGCRVGGYSTKTKDNSL